MPGHKPPCNGRLLQTHCHMKHPFSLCPVGPLRLTPKVSGLLGLWQQGQFCWMTWTFSASSLFRISHQTFLLVLFPSVFYYPWFSILDSNLWVGRPSSWIFFYSLWVLSEHSGSGREWGQRALCAWALPWSSCKGDRQGFQQQHFPPKPAKLWSQEKQHPQPEPREVKKNNSRFFLCQPTTLLNLKIQRNSMADYWNLESTRLWHWDREHFSLLFFNYLFAYTLSRGLWFKEWLFSLKTFKLKDQISHERHQPLIPLVSLGSYLKRLILSHTTSQQMRLVFCGSRRRAGGGRKRTHKKTSWALLVEPGYPCDRKSFLNYWVPPLNSPRSTKYPNSKHCLCISKNHGENMPQGAP